VEGPAVSFPGSHIRSLAPVALSHQLLQSTSSIPPWNRADFHAYRGYFPPIAHPTRPCASKHEISNYIYYNVVESHWK
jgi:hypothetical protein